jgi:hypothetical protein
MDTSCRIDLPDRPLPTIRISMYIDGTVARYRCQLSGPLLDRINNDLGVPRVPYEKLAVGGQGTTDDRRPTTDDRRPGRV